jgi:transposase
MDVSEINPDCAARKVLLKIIQQQQEQINRLEQRLEKVEREGKRQTAPYRKKRKANPKKSGRSRRRPWPVFVVPSRKRSTKRTMFPCRSAGPACGQDELAKNDTCVTLRDPDHELRRWKIGDNRAVSLSCRSQ